MAPTKAVRRAFSPFSSVVPSSKIWVGLKEDCAETLLAFPQRGGTRKGDKEGALTERNHTILIVDWRGEKKLPHDGVREKKRKEATLLEAKLQAWRADVNIASKEEWVLVQELVHFLPAAVFTRSSCTEFSMLRWLPGASTHAGS